MQARRCAWGYEIHAPAKLNLFLEVLGKRDDGFHEIETLMVPISWYDTLWLSDAPPGSVDLECVTIVAAPDSVAAASESLPEGPDNIVVRAIEQLAQRAGVNRGARVRLVKRIPLAAGLAGGSSDAAAALLAASAAWGLGWSRTKLAELAAELGSDVPFFLQSGPAICRGRGERVEPLNHLGPLHFVVVRPPVGLATADVYRACRPGSPPVSAGPLAEALRHGRLDKSARLFHNRLQEAAAGLTPWIARLQKEFDRLDCPGHQMSGSGTSYFGLCRHAGHARRLAARLRARRLGRVAVVHSSS